MLEVGALIGGRLLIERVLGQGGMGVVVAATHTELRRTYAVKLLHDALADNATIVERFVREARAVASLETEHVCRVIDVARLESGAPYIVMELLDGADLARVVALSPLPMTLAVEYVLQACVALAEAHAAGIVHRDLKPANLFVTRRPDGGPLVKVLDFGIAKAANEQGLRLTHSAAMMGSPAYISPEQIQSARDVDARTDIWSLGATLYQLLSARLPFASAKIAEMAILIATAAPAPLETDPALAAIVMRCLEKSPDARYPDVAELAAALAPFGGPSGRRYATLVANVARKPALAAAIAQQQLQHAQHAQALGVAATLPPGGGTVATTGGGGATGAAGHGPSSGQRAAISPHGAPSGQVAAMSPRGAPPGPPSGPLAAASSPFAASPPSGPASARIAAPSLDPSRAVALAAASPVPRRSRSVLIAFAAIAVVVGGALALILATRSESASTLPARDAAARIDAVVAAPPDSAPDAAPLDAPAPDAAPVELDAAPAPPPDAAPPTRTAKKTVKHGGPETWKMPSPDQMKMAYANMIPIWEQQMAMQPNNHAMVRDLVIFACMAHNTAKVHQYAPKLSPDDLAKAQKQCKKEGVTVE